MRSAALLIALLIGLPALPATAGEHARAPQFEAGQAEAMSSQRKQRSSDKSRQRGQQAYVVCPRIGDDGPDDAQTQPAGPDLFAPESRPPLAVLDVAEMLRSGPLAGLRLDVLHGRLTAEEKEARMRAFGSGVIARASPKSRVRPRPGRSRFAVAVTDFS